LENLAKFEEAKEFKAGGKWPGSNEKPVIAGAMTGDWNGAQSPFFQ
jgi:hypothetical protein